ncbi:MAG: protease [Candidatus Entotheonella factor]|uniref:Protease HtpX homolog n=1 Tax=Entotheonella factor TaxID=1429438 RepID=W4LUS5_ENTF1|nr:MAG: protease [Candidatus Entotheonella factor]
MNRIKSVMLLATLTALILWVGQALGGQSGLMLGLIFAAVMNFGAYWWSDQIVLRMYGAQEVSPAQAPELWSMVRELAQRANLPMPRLYIIPEHAPNAFATGRNPEHAAVAVTAGLLEMLDRQELAGVLAHELSHVKHRDTLIMTIAGSLAGAMSMIANMAMFGALFGGGFGDDDDDGANPIGGLLGVLIAPIAASLIQMAISRSREFMADEEGARLTRQPLALASALRKLESWKARLPMHAGSPATAHLFIVNPFAGGGLSNLFSTHPSTQERIERLQAMAGASRVFAA